MNGSTIMSLMIPARRPPASIETDQDSRPVYTIHGRPNSVFALQIPNKYMKTATVVFKRQTDALLMAHMIERHVRQKKEWPSNNIDDFHLEGGPIVEGPTELVSVKQWNLGSLKMFCVLSYLDMFTMNTLKPTERGFRMNGELVSLEVPTEVYAERLEDLWFLD